MQATFQGAPAIASLMPQQRLLQLRLKSQQWQNFLVFFIIIDAKVILIAVQAQLANVNTMSRESLRG